MNSKLKSYLPYPLGNYVLILWGVESHSSQCRGIYDIALLQFSFLDYNLNDIFYMDAVVNVVSIAFVKPQIFWLNDTMIWNSRFREAYSSFLNSTLAHSGTSLNLNLEFKKDVLSLSQLKGVFAKSTWNLFRVFNLENIPSSCSHLLGIYFPLICCDVWCNLRGDSFFPWLIAFNVRIGFNCYCKAMKGEVNWWHNCIWIHIRLYCTRPSLVSSVSSWRTWMSLDPRLHDSRGWLP